VRNGEDHIVGRGETVYLFVDTSFSNIFCVLLSVLELSREFRSLLSRWITAVLQVRLLWSGMLNGRYHVVGVNESPNFGVDLLVTNIFLVVHESNSNESRCWVSLTAIIVVGGLTSSERSTLNHVVSGDEAVDLFIDSLFTNILQFGGLENKIGGMSRWVTAIEVISSLASSERSSLYHVVGRNEAVNLFIDVLLTDVLDLLGLGGDSHKASRVLVLESIILIGGVSSGVRDAQHHVVSGGESVDFLIDTTLTDVLGGGEASRVLVLETIVLIS